MYNIYIIDHYNLLYYYCILPSVNCSNHPLYSINQDSKYLLLLYIFRRIDKGWAKTPHSSQRFSLPSSCNFLMGFPQWNIFQSRHFYLSWNCFRMPLESPHFLGPDVTWPMIGSQAMVLPFDLGRGWRLDGMFRVVFITIPSRELTYPTFGKGKSSSKCHSWGIC